MGCVIFWRECTMTENPSDSREAMDAAFLERVAGPLRSPEFLDPTFEDRLMEKIRREGSLVHAGSPAGPSGSWWRTDRVVRISPLKGRPSPRDSLVLLPSRASWAGSPAPAPTLQRLHPADRASPAATQFTW